MLHRKYLSKLIFILLFFSFSWAINSQKIIAYGYCEEKIENTGYYDCGNYIYTYYEDTLHSSIIYSLDKNVSILYAGDKDGISIFYADGFKFYNRSYDDTSKQNNDLWTTISTRGEIVFNGEFKDTFINDTHSGYYFYNLYRDVYTINQYYKGNLYRTIVIYNIDYTSISIDGALYDYIEVKDNEINEVLDNEKSFSVDVQSNYGLKKIITKINGTQVENSYKDNKIIIDSSVIKNYFQKGEESNIEVVVEDYFGRKCSKKYHFLPVSEGVMIKFSSMTSLVETASRRIVINASPGKGKQLDTDYCWYYWSTSPDDSLTYNEFLKNYASSNYKGSYSEDKGVILRNTTGVYYLYALAKDNNSWIVEKSEGYVLNPTKNETHYTFYDVIFVLCLILLAIIPVTVYLFIRKKENN